MESLSEPLDPETTEPADPWAHWATDEPAEDEWEPWNDYDWLTQDDDGTAEDLPLRPIRTVRSELL